MLLFSFFFSTKRSLRFLILLSSGLLVEERSQDTTKRKRFFASGVNPRAFPRHSLPHFQSKKKTHKILGRVGNMCILLQACVCVCVCVCVYVHAAEYSGIYPFGPRTSTKPFAEIPLWHVLKRERPRRKYEGKDYSLNFCPNIHAYMRKKIANLAALQYLDV